MITTVSYTHLMVDLSDILDDTDKSEIYESVLSACVNKEGATYELSLIHICLVLEDSEAGIQAAHSAGIDVICIPDMREPGEEFKKMVTAQLISLKDVIIW